MRLFLPIIRNSDHSGKDEADPHGCQKVRQQASLEVFLTQNSETFWKDNKVNTWVANRVSIQQ